MTTSIMLDPVTLPLDGNRLIEASAGTGKTFTIALLYVRLVLGPRPCPADGEPDTAAFPRPLTPPEILVVTFTNAATLELRDRIRARLVEAAELFQQPVQRQAQQQPSQTSPSAEPACNESDESNESDDNASDPLVRLRNQWPKEHWPACGRRLQLAAEWMDEAAISTIHSWCHRMLSEHAFDSGSLFSLSLETDQSELELDVARDYWRTFLYALPSEYLDQLTSHWETPEALHKALGRLLPHAESLDEAPVPLETFEHVSAETEHCLAALKAPWPAWLDELEAVLEDAASRKAFNGQKLNSRSRANWLAALRQWVEDPGQKQPALSKAAWERLTPQGMADIWKEGSPPDLPALNALAELPARLSELPDAYPALVSHAVRWMAERRHQAQARRAEIGPDDLLIHLDRALCASGSTQADVQSKRLAERIRRQFPVAMVDEFQDTDPVQYRLFDRVYRLSGHDSPDAETEPSAVLLIGDPKQAIYAFRGADIHTYLEARRATQGRHATLGRNFRSTQAMVSAVNHCFAQAENYSRGAFLFRQGSDNPLPFVPVAAHG
uniref:UvrD-helicase domain-containing protein n=1 Tax=Halomonas sp. TaxID=1486246 RepID=UPI00263591FD